MSKGGDGFTNVRGMAPRAAPARASRPRRVTCPTLSADDEDCAEAGEATRQRYLGFREDADPLIFQA